MNMCMGSRSNFGRLEARIYIECFVGNDKLIIQYNEFQIVIIKVTDTVLNSMQTICQIILNK